VITLPPAITACLLATGIIAAQDVFNSSAGVSRCDQAVAREQRTHDAKMAGLQRKETALREQYDLERSACGFKEPCLAAATRNDAERLRKLDLERNDELARFKKARIDAEHSDACMTPLPDGPPCEHLRAVEMKRYSLAMAELAKKEVDLRNRYEHDWSECRGDAACQASAARREDENLRELERQNSQEGTRRDKALADIDNSCETTFTHLRKIVKDPSNLAEIGCPKCPCVDLTASSLQVDQLVKGLVAGSYNCFFYAKTFMEGRLHRLEPFERAHGEESFADNDYMAREKYGVVASGINMNLFKAQIGDLIAVEGDNTLTPWRPWVHIAVVTSVDANGKILSTRQKPDPGHCVVDLSLAQFYKVYPVSGGYRYLLYRSHYLPGTLPRRADKRN
jgi:hypothetical protein